MEKKEYQRLDRLRAKMSAELGINLSMNAYLMRVIQQATDPKKAA